MHLECVYVPQVHAREARQKFEQKLENMKKNPELYQDEDDDDEADDPTLFLEGVEGKTHECPECSRSFRTPSKLRSHMRSHTGEKPYECHLCAKSFPYRGSLRTHLQWHAEKETGISFRPYMCSVCDKGFRTPSKLKDHMVKHTGNMAKCHETVLKHL